MVSAVDVVRNRLGESEREEKRRKEKEEEEGSAVPGAELYLYAPPRSWRWCADRKRFRIFMGARLSNPLINGGRARDRRRRDARGRSRGHSRSGHKRDRDSRRRLRRRHTWVRSMGKPDSRRRREWGTGTRALRTPAGTPGTDAGKRKDNDTGMDTP